MREPRHLRNAPIAEAIVDFRVKARADFRAAQFAELKARLADRFPKIDERRGIEGMVQFGRGKSQAATRDLGLQGYFFKSEDERNIAQYRIDGFTFNRLKPYTSWEGLFPLAMEMWRIYCEVAQPSVVTRLALRYINHVPLPPSMEDFDDYLRAGPVIPQELPQAVSSFLTRVTIHDAERGLAAKVSQALETDAAAKKLNLILDIDAHKQHDYDTEDPAVAKTFQELRDFKNTIFFNLLTDATLSQFE